MERVRTTGAARRAGRTATLLGTVAAASLALAGCGQQGVAQACPAAGAVSGVGISAVDGATDAQGRADLTATLCLAETCRTTTLAGEPNQRSVLVAGFVDLPLDGTDATTVRVTLQRPGAPALGPYEVPLRPTGVASGVEGCPTSAYVASVVSDALGVHEAPPPGAPRGLPAATVRRSVGRRRLPDPRRARAPRATRLACAPTPCPAGTERASGAPRRLPDGHPTGDPAPRPRRR